MNSEGKGGAVDKMRRSWSAGREQKASPIRRPDPAPVRSGPGVVRAFEANSQFKGNSSNYDLSDFWTTDFSLHNQDRHNWKKEDTFQTPAGHAGAKSKKAFQSTPHTLLDIEDTHVVGTCSFQKEWLIAMKNKIVEGVVIELQAETALIRQDIANITRGVQSEVLADLSAEFKVALSAGLSAEFKVLRDDLAEQTRVQLESQRQDLVALRHEIQQRSVSSVEGIPRVVGEMHSMQTTILQQVGTDMEHVMDQLSYLGTNHLVNSQRAILDQMNALHASTMTQIEAITVHSKANIESIQNIDPQPSAIQSGGEVDFETLSNADSIVEV
jgi:hypothetical protein